MNPEANPLATSPTLNSANVLSGVIRYLHAVRVRKGTLLATVLVSAVLGALYYTTATRYYDAHAQVNVLETENNNSTLQGNNQGQQRMILEYIPTYQKIISSDVVLRAALKSLPKESLVDFRGLPQELWVNTLKNNVIVSSERGTSLIDIRYRSRDPKAAAAIVGRIVTEYTAYVNETKHGSVMDALKKLTEAKEENILKLEEKDTEYLELRRQFGGFSDGEGRQVNVVGARVVELNKVLVETQRATLEAWSFQQSVKSALARGEDLQQLSMQAEPTLGQAMLIKMMGLDSEAARIVANANEDLNQKKSEFSNRRAVLGDNHPEIRERYEEITTQAQFINSYFEQSKNSFSQLTSKELGPQLNAIADQRLAYAWSRQQLLQTQFDNEMQSALGQNDLMLKIELIDLERKRLAAYDETLLKRISDLEMGAGEGIRVAPSSRDCSVIASIGDGLRHLLGDGCRQRFGIDLSVGCSG
jgi:uncharacterized protein involved in exopolysaccharide biosynthesis